MTGHLKVALRAFFQHDVGVHRDGKRLRLVLHDRSADATPRPPTRAERAAAREALELQQARDELERLLDDPGNLRPTLRHLAFVEHALGKRGFRGLYKVPLPVLRHALGQFEQLVSNWSPEGLACLRSKMAVAVNERRDEVLDEDGVRVAALLDAPAAVAARVIGAAAAGSVGDGAGEDDEAAALRAAYQALGVGAAA